MANRDYDDYAEPELKPKVSILTLVLCVLNVVAAGGFVYCLLLDLEKRQAWSYAVFLHDVAVVGLPLKEEEDNPFTASRQSLPKTILTKEQLAAVHKGVTNFQGVEEHLPIRVRPSHFNDDNLKDVFGEQHKPWVKSLEEEVDRVKSKLTKDIRDAAEQLADAEKTDDDKRSKLTKVLLPLALSTYQVKAFDKRVREAKDLKAELVEALQRRMLLDVLLPIEINRPVTSDVAQHLDFKGDPKDSRIDELAKQVKSIEELEGQLTAHLEHVVAEKYRGELYHGKEWDQKERDTIEKRKAIAFLLFAVAHLNKPDGTPLDPKAIDRAQIVLGLYEFSLSAQAYTGAILALEQRMLALIQADREGGLLEDKGTTHRTPGFVDRYPVMVQKLKEIVGDIAQAQKRLSDLKDQNAQAKKNYEDRVEHQAEIVAKLKAEREKTAKLYANLRLVQASLFRAQVELADAAEINFNLEIMIRKNDLKKGGTAP